MSPVSFSSLWGSQEMKCLFSVFRALIGETVPDVLSVAHTSILGTEGEHRWRTLGSVSVPGGSLGSPVLCLLEVVQVQVPGSPVC